jgi:hypothetical protein
MATNTSVKRSILQAPDDSRPTVQVVWFDPSIMDKLKLSGQNLGRVFKFRRGCIHAIELYDF